MALHDLTTAPRWTDRATAIITAAGRDRRLHHGDHQPPPVHAVGADCLRAAVDAGHRLLRHEHQGHAVPDWRRRHVVCADAGDRRGRADVVAVAADQGAVVLQSLVDTPYSSFHRFSDRRI